MLITIAAQKSERAHFWIDELKALLKGFKDIEIQNWNQEQQGSLVFIDCPLEALEQWLSILKAVHSKEEPHFFFIIDEKQNHLFAMHSALWKAWHSGQITGVLVAPFRFFEVIGCLERCNEQALWKNLAQLQTSFQQVCHQALQTVQEGFQFYRSFLSKRFLEIQNFQVMSRYLAGLAPGGDIFDLIESQTSEFTAILCTHSQSYSMNAKLFERMTQAITFLTQIPINEDPIAEIALQQFKKIITIMTQDRLQLAQSSSKKPEPISLLCGLYHALSKKFFFINFGDYVVYSQDAQKNWKQCVPKSPLMSFSNLQTLSVLKIPFQTQIAILSPGITSILEDTPELLLNQLSQTGIQDPATLIMELSYKIKQSIPTADDALAQDCTCLFFRLTEPQEE